LNEVEVKVIDIDKKEIIKKLESLDAEKVFDGDVFTVMFDFEDNRLVKQNGYLRLRKMGDAAFLTFKKVLSQDKAKVADEREVAVENFGETRSILEALGMKEKKSWAKHRISYVLDDIDICIDSQAETPDFLEIEAISEEEIYYLVDELELPRDKVKNWTGKELVEHYNKKA
jgi:adenylate cyclase class 2